MSKSTEFGFPVDRIYHGDSRHMKEVPDGVVSLIVTSPPYNVKKPYTNHDDALPVEEYEALLLEVWQECKRVLRPGGRLCVNVAGVWRQPYLPLHAMIWHQLVGKLGFQMRGEIIWNKAASVGVSTAWGSWRSASNPTLRDVHEYILVAGHDPDGREIVHQPFGVYSKEEFKLPNTSGRDPDISSGDFVELTKSVWYMPTDSAARVGHPAPFPEALPRRLIRLYTFPGDIVLDPFAGSGSTCVAACTSDRHYIGYDIDASYVAVARKRASKASKQLETHNGRKAKSIVKIPAFAILGPENVREREVKVDIHEGMVQLSVKTVGEPDIQKQNVSASLPAPVARQLAEALRQAAERVEPEQGQQDDGKDT